jgi:MoaA/NifB/PqqE/SkfB family radical SAM enzyme
MTRCWLSETHLAITPVGKALPCCRFKQNKWNVAFDDNLKTVFENSKLQDLRNSLQNNIKHERCSKCWMQEDNNILSMRVQYNKEKNFELLDTYNTYEKIHSLEIAFSNHCNYKCRHCNTFNSSRWKDDDIMLGNPVPDRLLLEPAVESLELDKLVNLEHIKMLGGEPLLSKQHKKLLQNINIEKINLEYVTNGSIWPDDEIVDLWKRAQSLHVIVSLDDIFDRSDYFRTDSNFTTIKNTMNRFEELRKQHLNMWCNIHCCINVLNLFHLDEIIQFMLEHFPNWHFTFDKIVHPAYLDISQWSWQHAGHQIHKLGKIDKSIPLDSLLNDHKKRNIGKIVKLLSSSCKNDRCDFTKLLEINTLLDKSRDTNLLDVHPYFERYI